MSSIALSRFRAKPIKLDETWFSNTRPYNSFTRKFINADALQRALEQKGWTQAKLADEVGVSSQSVTNWVQGEGFPRPAALLKLATSLRLSFDELVNTETQSLPIVAFRKKGSAKTTDAHIKKACEIGMLLKPLVPFLPEMHALRTLITSPSTDYNKLQLAVSQTRSRLGIGDNAVLHYEQLIGEFSDGLFPLFIQVLIKKNFQIYPPAIDVA